MELVFWASCLFIAYVYFGYPVLLASLRGARPRPIRKGCCEPSVTLVIAAHNEREGIEKKLKNCLQLDYPRRKLQIIVSLDGPTDGTDFIVRTYAQRGVGVVQSPEHRGKAAALNRALAQAKGEIVVFGDVRQRFDRLAIRKLVANFADGDVGAVSGELLLADGSGGESKTDIGLYWRYEKALRSLESQIHSMLGATGAIYAIRRSLYREIPEDTLLDDVLIPMRIVLQGKRAVFEPAAKAYDTVACCPMAEYRRKVRTLAGNYQILRQQPELLSPRQNPVFLQFVSHKIARLIVPYALFGMFVSNLFLLDGFYYAVFAGQCAWYLLAGLGWLAAKRDLAEPVAVNEQSRRAA